MDEDINGTSIPHLKGKTVQRNIQHVDPFKIPSVPKKILDKYKEVTILCDLMHINGIGWLNTIPRRIMFTTGRITKNRKIENISDGITQVHKLYLQSRFKITNMHADSDFEPKLKEMTALGINLKCAHKKIISLKLSVSSGPSRSASDFPKRPCRSNKYLSLW